jgi:magnesium-transporting ATPase (P-type)
MSAPHVVIQADRKALNPISVTAPRTAWRLLGWFGLLLAVVGFMDVALQWYPTSFKSPEWEFGTVTGSLATLPLLSIGLMSMLASFLARAERGGVVAMAIVFGVMLVLLIGAFLLFLSDVPLALKASTSTPVVLTMKKSIIRTTVMALGFGTAYLVAVVVSFRYLFRRIKDV